MEAREGPAIVIEPGTQNEETERQIYRNLQVLYNTTAGEQALDREFGIDAGVMDVPQETARALLAAEYVRKTERYEPRARVSRVEWVAGGEPEGNLIPKVVIQIV